MFYIIINFISEAYLYNEIDKIIKLRDNKKQLLWLKKKKTTIKRISLKYNK